MEEDKQVMHQKPKKYELSKPKRSIVNWKLPIISGLISILTGTVLWLISNNADAIWSGATWLKFMSSLGATLITLGLIAILVDLPDWRNYFGKRLKEIVLDRKYLENLGNEELLSVQKEVMKSRYQGNDIDKEDSFLQYMLNSIEHLINSPYREHVSANVQLSINSDGSLMYDEELSYTLRTIGKGMITEIPWIWEKNGKKDERSLKLSFKCPKFRTDRSLCTCKKDNLCNNGFREANNLKPLPIGNNEYGFNVKIDNYLTPCDRLAVFMEMSNKTSPDKLFSWNLAYPSKDIHFTVVYPKEYKLDHFIGGLSISDYFVSKNLQENVFNFVREGWMLPTSGIAFSLTKQQ